jgi:ubiquinol-cytochrome c reductase cytochrome b subunit
MKAVREFLRERGVGGTAPATIVGGASFAYVLGAVLLLLLFVEVVSGAALGAFYTPSQATAWGSVAYIQDQLPMGWLARGLHAHGAAAIVVVAGFHLAQTALFGAYKRPRELLWWLGVVLLLLLLGWAVTGYALRWDQDAAWANHLAGEAASPAPSATGAHAAAGGGAVRGLDEGNLQLGRFYLLHVMILPLVALAVVAVHAMIARKLGPTPANDRNQTSKPRWPDQTLRNAIAMGLAFAILLAYVVATRGVGLGAPLDPSQAQDARPLWYLRWLSELRTLAGGAAGVVGVALIAALMALPLVDRAATREPRKRMMYLGGLGGMLAVIGGLTIVSLARDAADDDLAARTAKAEQRAALARKLARQNGVPASGAADVFWTSPMARARALYASRCKSCHDADSKDRKGPIIAPGHGNRTWLKSFVRNPGADEFWGRTRLAKSEGAMRAFAQLPEADLDSVVELIYSESGATDVDAAKRKHGITVFEAACSECHAREEGLPGAAAPGLGGVGSRPYYLSFISNPKSALHMRDDAGRSEMPRYDRELTLAERDALAEYMVWLRTATLADLAALDPY